MANACVLLALLAMCVGCGAPPSATADDEGCGVTEICGACGDGGAACEIVGCDGALQGRVTVECAPSAPPART